MVTLTCSSDANPAVESYTWFKVDESTPVGSGQQYSISNISSEDAGQYYCGARNHYGFGNSSPVSISVTYRPRNTVVEIDPPGQITEGSRVTLTCSTDANPPAHTYSWYKTGTHVQLSSNEQLTFSQISSDDSGGYFCRAVSDNGQQDSPAVSVRVLYPPRNTRIESDSSGQVPVGATVTLTCTGEADPPAHTYTWIKKRGDVQLESGKEKTLTLSKIRPEDRGEYLCRVANEIGQQESPAVSVQVACE
ncbi:hypothetical protein ACEWY4_017307 [Coilia grayii]|uniref:Ig-like domain-containing protein n=1 Tax=Coilia grayii TaxID=363190 RepID=A0ABD1JGH9_9TELE